jgi:hypothetical protein
MKILFALYPYLVDMGQGRMMIQIWYLNVFSLVSSHLFPLTHLAQGTAQSWGQVPTSASCST